MLIGVAVGLDPHHFHLRQQLLRLGQVAFFAVDLQEGVEAYQVEFHPMSLHDELLRQQFILQHTAHVQHRCERESVQLRLVVFQQIGHKPPGLCRLFLGNEVFRNHGDVARRQFPLMHFLYRSGEEGGLIRIAQIRMEFDHSLPGGRRGLDAILLHLLHDSQGLLLESLLGEPVQHDVEKLGIGLDSFCFHPLEDLAPAREVPGVDVSLQHDTPRAHPRVYVEVFFHPLQCMQDHLHVTFIRIQVHEVVEGLVCHEAAHRHHLVQDEVERLGAFGLDGPIEHHQDEVPANPDPFLPGCTV